MRRLAVWFVRFSAWARERATAAAFARGAISRTEYERSMGEARDLRLRAVRLLAHREVP